MILTCPNCETQFSVPDQAIGPSGRKVRCSKCTHVWHVAGESEIVVGERIDQVDGDPGTGDPAAGELEENSGPDHGFDIEDPLPEGDAISRVVRDLADDKDDGGDRGRRQRTWLGWLFLAAIVAAVATTLVVYEERIVRIWPPAYKLYETVDDWLEEEIFGLDIANVTSERSIQAGRNVLVIKGEVVNISKQVKDVPRLKVSLLSDEGGEIYYWTVTVAQERLEPGQRVAFTTQLPNPPETAASLKVTFQPAR